MNQNTLIGLTGGHDATYFKIISRIEICMTKYWPAIKCGKEISILDVGTDEYLANKVEKERQTIRYAVAGNCVSAESAVKNLGAHALAVGPTTLEVYP